MGKREGKIIMDSSPMDIGRQGEELASRFLKRKGYRIIERNYRCRWGEIDIVAREGRTYCFIEVRTRRSLSLGLPEESITAHKQRQMVKAARAYLSKVELEECGYEVRFDIVSIVLSPPFSSRVEIIKGAFEVEE